MPGERTSTHVAAGLDDQVVAAREVGHRPRQPPEGRVGVGQPAGVDRDRQPLLLDVGIRGAVPAQQPRQLAVNDASPGGGRGEITRRLVEVQRSLPYWPKT